MAGHYYTRDGQPRHTVLTAAGKERPTNIRDARKLRLLPSSTSVLDVVRSEALDDYRMFQVAQAAAKTKRKKWDEDWSWMQRVRELAETEMRDAQDMGTKIHAALEAEARGEPYAQDLEPHVKGVVRWRNGLSDMRVVEIEKVVVNLVHGYAGTADKLVEWPDCVGALDYKTRKTTPGKVVKGYPTQGMQLASYIAAWKGPAALEKAKAANVFISTTEPGRVDVHWHDNLLDLYQAFLHCCGLWRFLNKYDPRAIQVQA